MRHLAYLDTRFYMIFFLTEAKIYETFFTPMVKLISGAVHTVII